MKKIIFTLAALALLATNAMAFTLNGYSGPVVISYTGWETLITGPGQTLSGYYNVRDIEDNLGNVVWQQSAGNHLTGVFNGLISTTPIPGPGSVQIDFTGGNTSLYYNTSTNPLTMYNPANPTSATFGTQVMSVNFVPGIDPQNSNATFQATLTALTGFNSGSGQGYGAVVAGSGDLANILNTNGFLGGAADLFFTSTLTDKTGKPFPNNPPNPGYPVFANDPVVGAAVPEPGTFVLLGAGLLGLVGLKRRRS